MSIVLRNQVEAAGKSADELLMVRHRDAMFAQDVQDLVRAMVDLFDWIASDVARAQKAFADSPGMANEGQRDHLFREWHNLYKKLANTFTRADPLIGHVEALGHAVDRKRRFHEVWRNLRGIAAFDYDDMLEAQRDIREGKTAPLAEVWDELWNKPSPQGR